MADVSTGERFLLDEQATREALGGLGRTKLYQLTAEGSIDSVKIGRRRFWPVDGVAKYAASLVGR